MAFKDLCAFVTILLLTVLSFAVFGTVIFGDHVRDFHNIPSAFMTMLYWVVGDFSIVDYDAMKQANGTMAPVFITAFLLLVVLTAINMFIAIVMSWYQLACNASSDTA